MLNEYSNPACSKCGSQNVETEQLPTNGLEMNIAIYGFNKYRYSCNSCGNSGRIWV